MGDLGNVGHPVAEMEDPDECPVKQVNLTVPKTDDPTIPVVTFRMWVLGLGCCILLSFLNQFFWYRKQPLTITAISAQIAVVPIGHLMARTITKRVFFEGTKWEFTMNPGPFNVKEHVLITIFANSGAGTVYATHVVSAVRLLYKRDLSFFPAFIIMLTTQVLGFGWAGLFRKYLVEPAEMWWPNNLVQVSLFRALHENEKREKGRMTRNQFFLIAFICSFAYYIFPGYLFTLLTSFSWLCWVAPKSVLVQQLGSGLDGLGIGALGLDWTTISSYLGSPLASPWFATANIAAGYFLIMYVMTPLSYWLDVYNAKTFPIYSSGLFMSNGSSYNISNIVNSNFQLDEDAYQKYGQLHLSSFFAMTYGTGFAALSATVVHIILFNGRDILRQTREAFAKDKKMDVHTRLMQVYKGVPTWWFLVILVVNIVAIFYACIHYSETFQLPWWGVVLACGIAVFFTLPVGIINATTNQAPGLNIITEYIIGYLYPERPVANMCFKVYGYISMSQALTFLQDFKLGHYMKIPPRSMFMAQVVGTVVSVVVYQGTAWWMMASIPNLCDKNLLPANSQWTCPSDHVFYDASVIWGLLGPRRIFGNLGPYSNTNWFFLGGAIAPLLVWLAHKSFPEKKWIKLIHMPVLIGATGMMPPASSINFTSWLFVGFLSGYVVFRYRPQMWARYNYVLSGGLDAGTAFMSVLIFLMLQMGGVTLGWWGADQELGEHCLLATCPTAKGVVVDGCPSF